MTTAKHTPHNSCGVLATKAKSQSSCLYDRIVSCLRRKNIFFLTKCRFWGKMLWSSCVSLSDLDKPEYVFLGKITENGQPSAHMISRTQITCSCHLIWLPLFIQAPGKSLVNALWEWIWLKRAHKGWSSLWSMRFVICSLIQYTYS